MRVKICGVRTVEDARMCVASGADAVGMLLAPSPRRITEEQARAIVKSLPPFVAPVIVMMPATADEAIGALRATNAGVIQLQGDEPPEMLAKIRQAVPLARIIKAVHMGAGDEPETARAYDGVADAILLDTGIGGSGRTHDWAASAAIAAAVKSPVVLAGGLKPENVAAAVRAVRPFAVDVSSGVEGEGRIKDIKLIQAFIKNAKEASNGQ